MKRRYGMGGITVFAWGTMAPVSKVLLGGLGDMEVLGYGSAIGAIALFCVMMATKEWKKIRSYRVSDLMKCIILGFVGYFLYSACYFRGLRLLSAQTACVLNYLWPIFSVIFSIILLGENLRRAAAVSILLSFAAVAVMMAGETGMMAGYGSGYLYCIAGALLYGLFNVLNKGMGNSSLINMFCYMTVGAVAALVSSIPGGSHLPTGQQMIGLLWLGIVVDAAGFLLWALALQGSQTASIAPLAYMTPVVSCLLSVLLFHEPVNVSSLLGMGFILSGMVLQIVWAGWKRRQLSGTGERVPAPAPLDNSAR